MLVLQAQGRRILVGRVSVWCIISARGLTSENGTLNVREDLCDVQAHEHLEQNDAYGVQVSLASVQ